MKEPFWRLGRWVKADATAERLSAELERLDAQLAILRNEHQRLSKEVRLIEHFGVNVDYGKAGMRLRDIEAEGKFLSDDRHNLAALLSVMFAGSGGVNTTKVST